MRCLAWLLLVTAGLAGCVTTDVPWNDCPAPEVLLYHGESRLAHTGDPAPLLFWSRNTGDGAALINTHLAPSEALDRSVDPGADGEVGRAGLAAPIVDVVPANASSFGGLWVDPTAGAANGAIRVTSLLAAPPEERRPEAGAVVACGDPTTTEIEIPLSSIAPGEFVMVGKGVRVHTVGLWENGTSFYTNDADYHEGPFPRSYLGAYGGSDTLPVYVYETDRSEMPPRYQRAGFFTTIPGFNEALKRMQVGVPTLTYFPGEEGYTRDGNEDHALYGEDLLFYIEAIEVVEVPCEVPEPVCDVPEVPPPRARHLLTG